MKLTLKSINFLQSLFYFILFVYYSLLLHVWIGIWLQIFINVEESTNIRLHFLP